MDVALDILARRWMALLLDQLRIDNERAVGAPSPSHTLLNLTVDLMIFATGLRIRFVY